MLHRMRLVVGPETVLRWHRDLIVAPATPGSYGGGRDYWNNKVPTLCAPDIGAHQYSTPVDNCPIAANGGFDTGSLSPWTAWNSASVVTG